MPYVINCCIENFFQKICCCFYKDKSIKVEDMIILDLTNAFSQELEEDYYNKTLSITL